MSHRHLLFDGGVALDFPHHDLPAYYGSGGVGIGSDDAFVDYGGEAGLSLLKGQSGGQLSLYGDVLALGTSPYYNTVKGHETLPLFEPTLLKHHGRHSTLARAASLSRLRNGYQSRKMIPSRPSSSSSPSPIAVYKSSPSYKSSSSSPIGKSISPKSSSSSLRSQNRSPLSVKNCNSAKSNNSLKGKSSALRSLPTPPPSRSGSGSGSGARLSSHSHYTPGRPRPSKTLSRALENELRVLAFDIGDGQFNGEPTLLIANPDSNCHAVFWAKPDRTEIVFHHGRLKEKADPTSTTETTNDDKHCGCMVKGAPGTSTFDIPPRLDEYRLELILGIGRSGIKMEPKLAAMVVMKLFLGMEVPKALRM